MTTPDTDIPIYLKNDSVTYLQGHSFERESEKKFTREDKRNQTQVSILV